MKRLTVLALALGLATGCTASVESTEVGVRTKRVSLVGERGVVKEPYLQGTHFFFRPFSDWAVYDTSVQTLEMSRETVGRGDDSIQFKTIDGNDISVNVTITWHIEPDRAHYLLEFVGDSTSDVGAKLVRPVARALVRDVLNQLTSEEYYQAERRFQMGEEAKERLNVVLKGEGVVIDNVLLGEHTFRASYEEVIRDKKVAEQEAARLVSATESAREEKKRDLEEAKGEVVRDIEVAQGESEKKRLEADAIYFEKQREAEAILTEAKARAEGLTERAAALAGAGGEAMVKLKVAESLKGKKIVFIPAGSGLDLRNTDVNDLLQVYGVKAAAGGGQ